MPGQHLKSVAEIFGQPDPPKTGRERLIAHAIDLFSRKGFTAVGVDQIIAKAGVTKTTFYKHFESKDDLMVAAVKRRDVWAQDAWDRKIREVAGDDPARQLLAVLDVMDMWFNAPDYAGCMFINAAAEFPNPNDPVHQAAAAHKHSMRKHWLELALVAGADGAEARAFADCFTAVVEGAFTLRQTYGRNDAACAVRPAVKQLIASYLPDPRKSVAHSVTPEHRSATWIPM